MIGTAPRQVIGVPEEIEGFPDILDSLSALHPITETRNDRSVKAFVLTGLALAGFLGMTWARQPQVAITLAVLVSGAVLWFIVYLRRSPNVSLRSKRAAWWYLILVGVCLLKILQVLRSS